MASRVVIRVNLEKAEAIHRHGHLVASRVNQVDTQVTPGAVGSQERAVVDQERVESLEAGVQVPHLVTHIVINLAMAEDTQMVEEGTTADITVDMAVIQVVAQVAHGLPAVNLGRAAAALRGLPVVNQARAVAARLGAPAVNLGSQAAIHLLRQAHGIHQVVPTLNHPTPNLPTVVVPKMMGTGILVDTEANGTRGHPRAHRGRLVASRVRAEEAHHRALGVHLLRVNLASLGTEI